MQPEDYSQFVLISTKNVSCLGIHINSLILKHALVIIQIQKTISKKAKHSEDLQETSTGIIENCNENIFFYV